MGQAKQTGAITGNFCKLPASVTAASLCSEYPLDEINFLVISAQGAEAS